MSFADEFMEAPRPVRARRKAVPGPQPSERAVQMAIIARLHTQGVFTCHIPNAGKRGAVTGARLKQEGMVAGFPDLYCANHGRHVLLEVKAATGRLSPNQVDCHAALRRRGVPVAVVYSQDEAVAACIEAGVIKA